MRAPSNLPNTAIAFGFVLLVAALVIALWPREGTRSASRADRHAVGESTGTHTGAADSRPSKSSDRNSPTPGSRVTDPLSDSLSGSLDGWTVNGPPGGEVPATAPWSLVDGRLVSAGEGGIAREVEMPPFAKLSFNLEWDDEPRFQLFLFGDDGQTTQPANAIGLVIQRRFVYLRKVWMEERKGGNDAIGHAVGDFPTDVQQAGLKLYIARDAKSFALYVDGRPCGIWQDPKPEDGAFGNWMQFLSRNGGVLSLSNLTVTDWDGALPEGHDMLELLREAD